MELMSTLKWRAVIFGILALGIAGSGVMWVHTRRLAQPSPRDAVRVVLQGTTFELEVADTPELQSKGLAGRESLGARGGMLFVYAQAQSHSFVMRDCTIPLDAVFVDDSLHIVANHTMTPEAPRSAFEKSGREGDARYESRLKAYLCVTPARYVLEVAAGTIKQLGLREGQSVRIEGLRAPVDSR